jgi:hypothetical protein
LTQHEVEVRIKDRMTAPVVTGNTHASTRVGKEHADGLKVLGLHPNVSMVAGARRWHVRIQVEAFENCW